MSKPDFEILSKHTLHLYSGDYKRLQDNHPDLGAAVVIRKLVRNHLNRVEPAIDTSKIKGDIDE